MRATGIPAIRTERIILKNVPVLPTLVGAAAPDESTEAETGQLYLKTGSPEGLWICVQEEPVRRWRRIAFAKNGG